MGRVKKFVARHFRILTLFVLSLAIVFLALVSNDQPVAVPFKTLSFSLLGSGPLNGVEGVFDFQNKRHVLAYSLAPGDYSMSSSTGFRILVDGVAQKCAVAGESACQLALSKPSSVSIVFNGSEASPNSRFRLSFFNKTSLNVSVLLGENYSFVGLYSVLPREIHGEFVPENNQILLQTYVGAGDDYSQVDFVDFDLYALNATSKRINADNDWREDYVILPLMLALLLLLISDVIDYAHDYVKKKVRP